MTNKSIKIMYVPSFYEGYTDTVYVGSPEDIKTLYKCISRAYKKGKTDIFPEQWGTFEDGKFIVEPPIFNPKRSVYGLSIDGRHGTLSIVGQDLLARWMFDQMKSETYIDF